MKRYPWKWSKDETFMAIFGGVWRVRYSVPPDTARRALRRRDMETLEALEAIEPLPSKPAAPGEHYWLSKTQRMAHFPNLDDAYTSCLWCGTVKRADGLNKPCPGIIGIRLRADGARPPRGPEDADAAAGGAAAG